VPDMDILRARSLLSIHICLHACMMPIVCLVVVMMGVLVVVLCN
jgi:hypothetical protein